jgi:hypothetical protein
LSGHFKDKDRARRKRKLQGQAAPKQTPRKGAGGDVEDPDEGVEPPNEEA